MRANLQNRLAKAITDSLDPKNIIALLSLLVGLHYGWSGLGWAVLTILFCAVLPIAYIVYTDGRGDWAARHVPDRARRLAIIPVILASVGTCLALMHVGNAPSPLLSMVAAMLATLGGIWPITLAWKISVHTAVLTGALAMLAMLYGPWLLLGAALVPAVAWSRARLKDHTVAQTIAGAALGATVAAPVFGLGL
ncbi:hypothetical protein [Streptomyces albidoflavus]|uniref:hypothetical protein n=1 Tax=Streptomyces albidoflavus TaxID=1886 RepID=UPI0033FBDAAF